MNQMSLRIASVFCLTVTCTCFSQAPSDTGKAGPTPALRGAGVLFSWQDPRGEWSFSVFEWVLGRLPTPEDVHRYSVLQGVDELKRRIARLPRGYILSWEDERMMTPGSARPGDPQRLTAPPPAVVADLKRFAAAHHVKLVGPDALPGVQRK